MVKKKVNIAKNKKGQKGVKSHDRQRFEFFFTPAAKICPIWNLTKMICKTDGFNE